MSSNTICFSINLVYKFEIWLQSYEKTAVDYDFDC